MAPESIKPTFVTYPIKSKGAFVPSSTSHLVDTGAHFLVGATASLPSHFPEGKTPITEQRQDGSKH